MFFSKSITFISFKTVITTCLSYILLPPMLYVVSQERLAKSHGTQCGFCSPGMVMSMYALLRNDPHPSQLDVEKVLAGIPSCYMAEIIPIRTVHYLIFHPKMLSGRACSIPTLQAIVQWTKRGPEL